MTKELVIFATIIIVIVGGVYIGINNVILTEAPGSAYDPVAPSNSGGSEIPYVNVNIGPPMTQGELKDALVYLNGTPYFNKYNKIGPVDFYVK